MRVEDLEADAARQAERRGDLVAAYWPVMARLRAAEAVAARLSSQLQAAGLDPEAALPELGGADSAAEAAAAAAVAAADGEAAPEAGAAGPGSAAGAAAAASAVSRAALGTRTQTEGSLGGSQSAAGPSAAAPAPPGHNEAGGAADVVAGTGPPAAAAAQQQSGQQERELEEARRERKRLSRAWMLLQDEYWRQKERILALEIEGGAARSGWAAAEERLALVGGPMAGAGERGVRAGGAGGGGGRKGQRQAKGEGEGAPLPAGRSITGSVSELPHGAGQSRPPSHTLRAPQAVEQAATARADAAESGRLRRKLEADLVGVKAWLRTMEGAGQAHLAALRWVGPRARAPMCVRVGACTCVSSPAFCLKCLKCHTSKRRAAAASAPHPGSWAPTRTRARRPRRRSRPRAKRRPPPRRPRRSRAPRRRRSRRSGTSCCGAGSRSGGARRGRSRCAARAARALRRSWGAPAVWGPGRGGAGRGVRKGPGAWATGGGPGPTPLPPISRPHRCNPCFSCNPL